MEYNFKGKTVLVVQRSLLAGSEIEQALRSAGARVYLTGNIVSAFDLVQRARFDGAIIDQGFHNEAFDLCEELRDHGVPYIASAAPHKLAETPLRRRDAAFAVWRLGNVITGRKHAHEHVDYAPGTLAISRLPATSHPKAQTPHHHAVGD